MPQTQSLSISNCLITLDFAWQLGGGMNCPLLVEHTQQGLLQNKVVIKINIMTKASFIPSLQP
jgi:hypothetical protein